MLAKLMEASGVDVLDLARRNCVTFLHAMQRHHYPIYATGIARAGILGDSAGSPEVVMPNPKPTTMSELFASIVARDETERALEEVETVMHEARKHVQNCLDKSDGWCHETLAVNLGSSFPDLPEASINKVVYEFLGEPQ
jgi:hypothetical protein